MSNWHSRHAAGNRRGSGPQPAAAVQRRAGARRHLSHRRGEPAVVTVGSPASWTDLTEDTRAHIRTLAGDADALVPDTETPGAAGIALRHPEGVLVLWIELGAQRLLTSEEQTLLTVLTGRLTQGLHRVHQIHQQRETALAGATRHPGAGPAADRLRRPLPAPPASTTAGSRWWWATAWDTA